MVADSALYTAPNLALMQTLKWLSRVPLTVKQAQQLISQLADSDFVASEIPGYRWSQHQSKYGGIQQRWLVVESDARRQSDVQRQQKTLDKASKEANKNLRELSHQKFACQPDAIAAAQKLSQQLRYHNLTAIEIVEVLSESPDKTPVPAQESGLMYKVQARLEPASNVIAAETRRAGRFVLATNVFDVQELSNDQMLSKYKEQQSSERGFGFLKDPLFFTDSVFLKSPERVESLALVMGLCLLVYTLAQRQRGQTLKQSQCRLKNQLGQLTERPTLRWIFQCFQAVHLLIINGVQQISNLTDERLQILRFFPDACRSYYLLL